MGEKRVFFRKRFGRNENKCSCFRAKAGESLVEVMVSAVIFLILAAVLQGAVTFCTRAQHRSREIRRRNAEICEALQTTPANSNGFASFEFKATNAEGTQTGNTVLFQVEVPLEKKEVPFTDADGAVGTTVFYLFGSSGGGGSP